MALDQLFSLPTGPLHARAHGAEGHVVIGVPGLSANAFTFEAVGQSFAAAKRRLIALDLRGRGHSPPGAQGTHGWDNHARDVLAVADSLGVEHFDYVGHSMGAFVGLALNALAPQRARRLVLVDALGVPHPTAMPPILAAANRLGTVYPSSSHFLEAVQSAGVVPWTPNWERHYREDLIETDGGVRQRASKVAVLEDMAYAASTDVRALWPLVKVPALVIRAGQPFIPNADIITPEDLDAFLAVAPSARAQTIAANHYGVMDHPHTLELIKDFLS